MFLGELGREEAGLDRLIRAGYDLLGLQTDFYSESEANHLYTILQKEIHWQQEPIILFGKKVMQPRLAILSAMLSKMPYAVLAP